MNEETIAKACSQLFPNEGANYKFLLRFSRKFNSYNANVRKAGNSLTFSLSPEWKKVSEPICIGLVQELLQKILRKKITITTNMQLYSSFIKNLHLAAAKTEADEKLLQVFDKVNEKYFNSSLETPNLKWSLSSRRRLATYDYHTDTINVSTIFREAEEDILAYLLYHEMLHKKLKFSSNKVNGRTIHHSSEFRKLEQQFENRDEIEQQLQGHLRIKHNWPRNFAKCF